MQSFFNNISSLAGTDGADDSEYANTNVKTMLKEKIVTFYESLFKPKESNVIETYFKDPTALDEIFLLKVNNQFLENIIDSHSEEKLLSLCAPFNEFCKACLRYLSDENHIRRMNALQTLCILFRSIFRKKWKNFGVNVSSIICGFQQSDVYFKELITKVKDMISDRHEKTKVQQIGLLLFVIILTGCEILNQNSLIDYFTLVDISDSLISIIDNRHASIKMKKSAIICFCVLCNYRKYETSNNIYVNYLQTLQQPSILMSFSDVITKNLYSWNLPITTSIEEQSGIFTYLSGFIFGGQNEIKCRSIHEVNAFLLIFYELVHLNKDFVGSLTRSLSIAAAAASQKLGNDSADNSKNTGHDADASTSTTSVTKEKRRACPLILQEFFKVTSIFSVEPYYPPSIAQDSEDVHRPLFDDPTLGYYMQLCLNTILFLTEQPLFRKFLFSMTTHLDFFYFKKEKGYLCLEQYEGTGTLARPVLELMIQFLHHNVRKPLNLDHIGKALATIHLIIITSKEQRIRLDVAWPLLWSSLIRLCELLSIISDGHMRDKVITTLRQVFVILNLGIMQGELFLPTRKEHDEMLYEFIRQKSSIQQILEWFHRVFKKKNPIQSLTSNIELMVNDISMELDLKYSGAYPSEKEVLSVIKKIFNSSKLQKIGNLDDPIQQYFENPQEINFFSQFLRIFVLEVKSLVNNSFSKSSGQSLE